MYEAIDRPTILELYIRGRWRDDLKRGGTERVNTARLSPCNQSTINILGELE